MPMRDSDFSPTSYFDMPRAPAPSSPPAPSKLPTALFASTTSGYQGPVVEIKAGQLRSWWHDIDDALSAIEEGNARGIEEAVRLLGTLNDQIDDLVRSTHGSSYPDRTPGQR